MKTIITLLTAVILSSGIFSQNINGKLGTNGQFIIRDTTNTFLTLQQTTGYLNLNRSMVIPNTANATTGVIFKGANRFLHDYGNNNTFLGINSGNFTMTGIDNTAVGNLSLNSNTTGLDNSAFGVNSLSSNTTGEFNTAVGYGSLSSNTTGSNNSALGQISLTSNTTGNQNSALGNYTLNSNTTGSDNSAFGIGSLNTNTTGNFNSAFGNSSLLLNTTGGYNSGYGVFSLYKNTTGNNNSAFGRDALFNLTTGSNNTGIGYDAQVPSITGSNQVRIGNTSITYAGIQVAWTITSDRRWKDKIKKSDLGLNFINKLNPVSYTRKNEENARTEYGLIAQEVEEVLKQEGVENPGMLTITDEGMYELRYNDLLAPMIKAIQELKNEKDNEITMLKQENDKLKNEIENLISISENVAVLEKQQKLLMIEIGKLRTVNQLVNNK